MAPSPLLWFQSRNLRPGTEFENFEFPQPGHSRVIIKEVLILSCSAFLYVKNHVLARITEPSNDDGGDNCDHIFGTFGVRNYQKVSHNMILMSKYKEQHGGKQGKKIRARPSPPTLFGQCPKEINCQ